MSRKAKYQFGGDDSFFSQLADLYQQRMDYANQPYEQQDYDMSDMTDQQDQSDSPDYEELLGKYNELEDKVNALDAQASTNVPHDYGDSFMDFIFGDDNNLPIDWSDDVAGGRVPSDSKGLSNYQSKGFRTFSSYGEGRAALEHQLDLYKTGKTSHRLGPHSTLLEAMGVYAPSSDNNNPHQYAQFIANKLGISVDTPLSKVDTKGWADAIEKMEGNKYGNNPGNIKYLFGGGVPVAETRQELYEGMNNPEYAQYGEMVLDLPPQYNLIRGLDNGHPLKVQDQRGKSSILRGPNHTEHFYGRIYEEAL